MKRQIPKVVTIALVITSLWGNVWLSIGNWGLRQQLEQTETEQRRIDSSVSYYAAVRCRSQMKLYNNLYKYIADWQKGACTSDEISNYLYDFTQLERWFGRFGIYTITLEQDSQVVNLLSRFVQLDYLAAQSMDGMLEEQCEELLTIYQALQDPIYQEFNQDQCLYGFVANGQTDSQACLNCIQKINDLLNQLEAVYCS